MQETQKISEILICLRLQVKRRPFPLFSPSSVIETGSLFFAPYLPEAGQNTYLRNLRVFQL
jgi:hypothetical protein